MSKMSKLQTLSHPMGEGLEFGHFVLDSESVGL
jgi:hypothetical protein